MALINGKCTIKNLPLALKWIGLNSFDFTIVKEAHGEFLEMTDKLRRIAKGFRISSREL